jgi:hypothetical protein
MLARFIEELKRERALERAKITRAGYDPDAIIFRARLSNLWQDIKHALYNTFRCTRLRETTLPSDTYRTYEWR